LDVGCGRVLLPPTPTSTSKPSIPPGPPGVIRASRRPQPMPPWRLSPNARPGHHQIARPQRGVGAASLAASTTRANALTIPTSRVTVRVVTLRCGRHPSLVTPPCPAARCPDPTCVRIASTSISWSMSFMADTSSSRVMKPDLSAARPKPAAAQSVNQGAQTQAGGAMSGCESRGWHANDADEGLAGTGT
jgi:hypothetical protein